MYEGMGQGKGCILGEGIQRAAGSSRLLLLVSACDVPLRWHVLTFDLASLQEGQTALDIAKSQGRGDVVTLLTDRIELYPVVGEAAQSLEAFKAPQEGMAAAEQQRIANRQAEALDKALQELKSLEEGTGTRELVPKAEGVAEMLFESLATPGAELLPEQAWESKGERLALDLGELCQVEWTRLPLVALEAVAGKVLVRSVYPH